MHNIVITVQKTQQQKAKQMAQAPAHIPREAEAYVVWEAGDAMAQCKSLDILYVKRFFKT